jgi:D-glycero-D-manno-heptose 1,7-bisphosphate phosphatase
VLIILPERRRQAKRSGEKKQEKEKKYGQKCLGLMQMGKKFRMGPWKMDVPRAVLFDRDGTLVRDVPYNGNPALVDPFPQAAAVLRKLRRHGIRTGVITNQSGVARGLLTTSQVTAVNSRIQHLLGRFDVWEICPHGPGDGCACRKPQPGMIHSACARLGLQPAEVAVIGDIGADMAAAEAAGARAVLVPTPVTRPEETAAAPLVARDLAGAVALLLDRP